MIGDIYLQNLSKKSSSINNLLNTKNGNNAGTTAVAQTISPLLTDNIYFDGFNIKIVINAIINSDKTRFVFLFLGIFIFIALRGGL